MHGLDVFHAKQIPTHGGSIRVYAARLGLKTLCLGASSGSELPIGGVITTTNLVENYPGFIRLTGTELADKIREHAESYELVEIKEEKAEKVSGKAGKFIIKTKKNEYNGKTILFATGTKWRKLPESVKGAREFAYFAYLQPKGKESELVRLLEYDLEHNYKNLGADIIMAFDQCTPDDVSEEEAEKIMERTHRWAKRSLEEHQKLENQKFKNPSQPPLVRGGVRLSP